MLTTNLWIQTGLVNGSLGVVIAIVYNAHCKTPDPPDYVVVHFQNYIGPPLDPKKPRDILIPAITQGS